jgi:excinuclease ABC subunit B
MEIIRDLRLGVFEVLIGINLLREGLDIPEVALVAILDADKEGFLRSARSLIQTFGRAARNVKGRVILYADQVTPSMRAALDETNRRRRIQQAHNRANGIRPASIIKDVRPIFPDASDAGQDRAGIARVAETAKAFDSLDDIDRVVRELEQEMKAAVRALEFEQAADLRDRIRSLQKLAVFEG